MFQMKNEEIQSKQSDFEGPFCLSCTFIFRNEWNWMKKSARVSEKLVSPGSAGLQVATRLEALLDTK